MNRRDALKGIGLSFGYLVATPAVISLLHSCSENTKANWQPVFFNNEEAIVIEKIIDLILPNTDKYPGAKDLGIPRFIDIYMKNVADRGYQDFIKKGVSEILPTVKNGSDSNYHKLLTLYLKASEKETDSFKRNKKETLIYNLLNDLRKTTVWAFKATEKVGEDILAYDPIPGKYDGCITLEEATNGKAWSL